jgi:hypothetical protein
MCADLTCAFTYKLIFTYDLRPAFFYREALFLYRFGLQNQNIDI